MAVLAELKQRATHSYVSPYSMSWIYWGLGDRDNWMKSSEAALEERSGLLPFLKNAPWNDDQRSDPFFQELMRKVGLP